jgi:hypothetical protein
MVSGRSSRATPGVDFPIRVGCERVGHVAHAPGSDEQRQSEPAATQHLLSSPMQRPTDGPEPLASGSTKRSSIFAHWKRLVGQIRYKPAYSETISLTRALRELAF